MPLHLIVPVVYAVPFFFVFPDKWMYLQFLLGFVFGFLIFILDRFLHVFFIQPESEFSQQVKARWNERNFKEVVQLFVVARQQQQELMTRSVLFFIVYIGLAIYILTSTGSVVGMGLILGIGLHFCLDFWRYRQNEVRFHQQFLWQLKKTLAQQEITYLVVGFSLFFILLSMLAIR